MYYFNIIISKFKQYNTLNDDILYEIAHVLASNGYKAAVRRMEIALGEPKGFKELTDPISFVVTPLCDKFAINIETK